MVWLATQIWLALVAAFAAGGYLGWTLARGGLRRVGRGSRPAAARPPLTAAPFAGAEGESEDDLTAIIGVDAATAAALRDLGVQSLAQIAAWTPAHAAWIDDALARRGVGERGRVERERWVEQAEGLRDPSEAA